MLPIFLFLTLTFSSANELQDSQSPTDTGTVFTQALTSFKAQDYTKSRDLFKALLIQSPDDPVVLYNLGLVEFSENHAGAAAGYWRRALWLKPGYAPALSGLTQLQKKYPQLGTPLFPESLYLHISPWVILIVSVFALAFSGFSIIQNWQRQKKGEQSRWILPILGGLVFAGSFLICTHYFAVYSQEIRSTLIEAETPLYSSPSLSAPSLLNLPEGSNVKVLRESTPNSESKESWIQVQKSPTQVGWVLKDKVFVHSGI